MLVCDKCGSSVEVNEDVDIGDTFYYIQDNPYDRELEYDIVFRDWDTNECKPLDQKIINHEANAGEFRNADEDYYCFRRCKAEDRYTTVTAYGYTISIPEEEWLEIFSTK